jgi:phage-related minor tail protein
MQEVGGKISEVGEGLTTHVTAPIVAVGAASLAAFNEVDSGLDIVEQKTGATGQALEGHEPDRQRPCDGNSDRL